MSCGPGSPGAGCPGVRSGPAEPTGEEQDIGTAGWSEEMTLVDGEKAVERARDTSANGAGGQVMRRVALASGVRGLVDSRILPGVGPGGAIINSRAEPSRAEPSRAEPSRAEPSRAEPSRAEPSRAEPSRAEPSRAEPSRAEPSRAEPSRAEPSRAEPSRAEPSRAEPSRAEPSRAEPSRAEPSRAEPSRAEPSRAEPSRAEPSRALFMSAGARHASAERVPVRPAA